MQRGDAGARTVLVLAVAAFFLWMVRSILVPISLGAVFALLFHPIHVWLARRLGRLHRLSPIVITLAALIVVVLPLSAIGAHAVVSINGYLSQLDDGQVSEIQTSLMRQTRELADAVGLPVNEIRAAVTDAIRRAGSSIATFLSGFLTSLPEMILDIFLFVLSLYFFLRDGARLGPEIQLLSPFSREETEAAFDSVVGTVRGAILGTVAVAFVQGAETLIALLIFEIPGAFLFGLIATFMSLIPLVGTMPVTFGAVIYLFASGRIGASIGMLIAALIIGTSDNIVRPWVQSRGASMHPLMAMLGIFGGVAVMGMAGIFIGPIVSALVVWLLREKRRTLLPA
jgi:predicted PurR-regulated permease PerM